MKGQRRRIKRRDKVVEKPSKPGLGRSPAPPDFAGPSRFDANRGGPVFNAPFAALGDMIGRGT